MDTQQVEIIGKNLLISACIADGIEVSQPLRDRGIDLVIFNDLNQDGNFVAVPIQLKASSSRSFSINAKYAKFPNMIMAYTWFSSSPTDAQLYVLSYYDALKIAKDIGWLDTESWRRGAYSTQSPSQELCSKLSKFIYKPGHIRRILESDKPVLFNIAKI